MTDEQILNDINEAVTKLNEVSRQAHAAGLVFELEKMWVQSIEAPVELTLYSPSVKRIDILA